MSDMTLGSKLPLKNLKFEGANGSKKVTPEVVQSESKAPTDAVHLSPQKPEVKPPKTEVKSSPAEVKAQPEEAKTIEQPSVDTAPQLIQLGHAPVINVNQTKDPDLLGLATATPANDELSSTFINPLATVDPKEISPIGDLLSTSPEEIGKTLASRQDQIKAFAAKSKAFNTEFDDLTKVKDAKGNIVRNNDGSAKAKDVPVEQLNAFASRFSKPGGEKLTAGQMSQVMEAYKDRGHFSELSDFYEKMRTNQPTLGKYEIPREHYIVSLNKQKRIKESIQESEALINERVEEVNHGPMGFLEASRRNTYRDLGINGEVLAGLGKAYKLVHQQAESQIDAKVAQADLTTSYAQLTGTKMEDWKVGESSVGEVAKERTQAVFQKGAKKLFEADDQKKAQADFTDFVEKSTGTKSKDWAQPPSPALFESLKGAEDLMGSVESLTKKERDGWELHREQIHSVASAPINKLAGKVVRGRAERGALQPLLKEMTGRTLQGALASAMEGAKIDQIEKSVTKEGDLDPELVGRVENNSSSVVGKNLLKTSRKALEVSRDYYQAGFGVDVEYYPGINVIYNELALGNDKAAKGLTPIVQYAVMREGGAESKDYWNLATQVELGVIGEQPKTVHKLLPRLFDSANVDWELGSTADNLEALAERKRDKGEPAPLMEFVAKKFRERMAAGFPPKEGFDLDKFVKGAQGELEEQYGVTETTQSLTPEEQTRKRVTDRIHGKAKHFQSAFTSKFVGGSWKFVSRGGVSDRPINRATIRAMREVNRSLGFNDLKTPDSFDTFHRRSLSFIDDKFGLVDKQTRERPMENLEGTIHKKRDKFTEQRHEVFHSRTSGSAQTNLAVEIMLGQSDCRDTDATYQVMFDLWKRDQQTEQLQGAIDAVMDGRDRDAAKHMENAKDWDKAQVLSMDLAFYAPAKLNLDEDGKPIKYKISKNSAGEMLRTDDGDLLRDKDGKAVALEDHSMPFLARYDDKGFILPAEEGGLRSVDPFYREFWQLGDQPVDPLGILDDDKGLSLGVSGVNGDDGKPVELYGKPTKYSGAAPQDLEGEAGQVTLGGIEVAMKDLTPLTSRENKFTHLTDAVINFVPPPEEPSQHAPGKGH